MKRTGLFPPRAERKLVLSGQRAALRRLAARDAGTGLNHLGRRGNRVQCARLRSSSARADHQTACGCRFLISAQHTHAHMHAHTLTPSHTRIHKHKHTQNIINAPRSDPRAQVPDTQPEKTCQSRNSEHARLGACDKHATFPSYGFVESA